MSTNIQITKPDNLSPKTELVFDILFSDKFKGQNKRELLYKNFIKSDLITNLHHKDKDKDSDSMKHRANIKVSDLNR